MSNDFDLIVFSHLRWSFVWQRPQHLMSRFAKDQRVFFVEEPEFQEGCVPHWNITQPTENLFVCRPITPSAEHGFRGAQSEFLKLLIGSLLQDQNIDDYCTWFYTPMAFSLVQSLQPRAIIYDCMDELSAFRHAPPELLELESELLRHADVVFTGGPSLFRAKQHRHHNVHCFSSSVDADHFGQARGPLVEPDFQAQLPHPRLGFFGVIDERFDVPLLQAAAEARPEWQFVMVGPVVKIDPATLPQRSNIHYAGQRTYEELPHFLRGWDVCLLPFARNEATRFISPTKTLEYMAAEKPIVSTSITDVAEPYGEIVYLGDTPDEFIRACERALGATEDERNERFDKMRGVLKGTSWDTTVDRMTAEMRKVARNREPQSTAAAVAEQPDETEDDADARPFVVIGAGPTGLSAAYHLGESALLIERNQQVGGWCRSIEIDGFTFDFAGHIMFSNDKYVHEMYEMLLGENVHWQDREAWIYSKNVYTRYPFQGALYGLPPDVIKECLIGAIESRFGNLKPPVNHGPASDSGTGGNGNGKHHGNGKHPDANVAGGNGKASKNVDVPKETCRVSMAAENGQVKDCCADGIMESTAPLGNMERNGRVPAPPGNFEEFIYKVWGRGIAKHFAIPYNRKLWAVPLTEMETSWLGGRVPLPDLEEMIDGALSPVGKPMGPNARFGYPLRGGFQALMNGFLPHLKGPLLLETEIIGFTPSRHEVKLSNGKTVKYEQLISTMPLPVLIRLAGDEAPPKVQAAAKGLQYISVRCVHLGFARENLTEKHWIYYPEESIFHRIFVQGNASPHCNPPGGFGLTCEITYHPKWKPLPCDGDELIQRCLDDCRAVGIVNSDDDVLTATQVDLPHAYVIYDHARTENVTVIREWLAEQDVILAGRYSEWEYYNSDHAFLAGKKAAEQARARQRLTSPASVPAST